MFFKKNFTFFALVAAFAFSGCTPSADPKIDMKPPVYVEQLPPKQTNLNISNPGSLYGRGQNPLFADRKAMNINDIVTVVISENATQSSSGKRNSSNESNLKLGGGEFSANSGGVLSNVANGLNKLSNIGFSGSSSSDFSGEASSSRNEKFNTTISARIIKVLNNGNYFIEGNRELLINGEKQIIQLSGVIRPYDISQNNQIDSRYIADAKILYRTEGELSKSTKKGWGTKMLQALWPF